MGWTSDVGLKPSRWGRGVGYQQVLQNLHIVIGLRVVEVFLKSSDFAITAALIAAERGLVVGENLKRDFADPENLQGVLLQQADRFVGEAATAGCGFEADAQFAVAMHEIHASQLNESNAGIGGHLRDGKQQARGVAEDAFNPIVHPADGIRSWQGHEGGLRGDIIAKLCQARLVVGPGRAEYD